MPIVAPLLALDVIVLVMWVIAAALAIAIIMDKLASILHAVPIAGGYLSDKVHAMAVAISQAAASLESGIDSIVGAAWHMLARYLDKALTEFVDHSGVILHIARLVGDGIYSISGLKATVRAISYVAHAALKLADKLEKEYHGIEHRVKVIEREIGAGIGNDIRTRVTDLEAEVGKIEGKVIPGLRQGIATAEAGLTDLENWLGIRLPAKYLDWALGLVAAALGKLGWDFFKCAEWRRLGSILTCGMGQFLLDLLEGAIAIMLIEDICAITKVAIDVVESSEVSDFLTSVEDGMQDLFTCQGVDVAPALAGPYYSPPPLQEPAALAA